VLTAEPWGYRFPGYTLDLVRGCLRDGDREIKLRPQTFKVLTYFVSHPGRLLPKDELMEAAWAGLAVTDDSLVQCVKEIRRAIDDSAQVLIKTIPGRGYLFDLPVEMVEPKQALGAEPGLPVIAPIERVHHPAWLERIRVLDWRLVSAAIGVLVLLSGGIGWWVRAPVPPDVTSATATGPPRLSIAVLPFTNLSGDPAQDYFADGVTDNLTTDLSTHISGLFVIARNTAFTLKGKNVDVHQVGRDLNVRYVLEGSVQRSGDQVMVNAQLVDAQTGAHLWAERFQEERRELFALEDRVTGRIANSLGIQLVQAAARDTELRNSDPDAADLVMRGRAFRSLPESFENLNQAEALFRQALKIDNRSVNAHVGLANTLMDLMIDWGGQLAPTRGAVLREANEAADRALALDPDGAPAHDVKGFVLRAERRSPEAAHEFEIAVARDPNFVGAYDHLGAAQYRLGQPEKAIPLLEKALRLSPHDPDLFFFEWHLGTAQMFLHHYDLAVEHFLKAQAANSKLRWISYNLAGAYELEGDHETARMYVADALAWKPTLSISAIKATRESDDPEYLRLREETLITGLRRAGFPEE
jgi:adenylate cyclase